MRIDIKTIDYKRYSEAIAITEEFYNNETFTHVSNVAKLMYTMMIENRNRNFVDNCINTAYLHHILDVKKYKEDQRSYAWNCLRLLRAGFNMDVVSSVHIYNYEALNFSDFIQYIKPYCVASKIIHMLCLTDLNDLITTSQGVQRELYTMGAAFILK